MIIKAIAIDPAFANMGLARVSIDTQSSKVACDDLKLIRTEQLDLKVVRKSSSDLSRARVLSQALTEWCYGSTIAFAEIPSGAQSAAAAKGLGIAVGVIAGCPLPLIEVSPTEVKRLFGEKGPVSKAQIITWAMKTWPQAPWLKHKGKVTLANEHLADALAIVMAGMKTQEFQRLMALQNAIPGTDHKRPASRRKLLD